MKKSLLLLSGLVASSIVLTSFNRPAKDDVGQKYMDAAVNLVDVGEYKLALKVLKDCDRPFADALRMEAYDRLDRTRKAIRYGVEYMDVLGQQDVRDSTISVNSYVRLYLWKSTCYYGLDDYDNAIKTISQAVDATSGKDYSHLCQRGFYYMQAEMFDEAMEDYATATEINPDNALAYFGKCAVLFKQGKLDKAKAEYGRGIKIDPEMETLEYNEVLQEIVTGFSKGRVVYKRKFDKFVFKIKR